MMISVILNFVSGACGAWLLAKGMSSINEPVVSTEFMAGVGLLAATLNSFVVAAQLELKSDS